MQKTNNNKKRVHRNESMCFEILSSRIVGVAFTVGGENKQTKT